MACYDVDRFREFVASDGFAELFGLPAGEMEKVLADDTELMLFGFRFLSQTLFGETAIPVRSEVADQQRARGGRRYRSGLIARRRSGHASEKR
jgi:hypothetical protein